MKIANTSITNSLVNYGKISGASKVKVSNKIKGLNNGYVSIVSKNDMGKSTILQLIFSASSGSMFIPAERLLVKSGVNSLVGSIKNAAGLNTIIDNTRRAMSDNPIDFSSISIPSSGGSPTTDPLSTYIVGLTQLINVEDRDWRNDKLNPILKDLVGYELKDQANEFNVSAAGADSIQLGKKNSGTRAIIPIAYAVETKDIILIDEPELSLEPRLQKKLRDYLFEKSKDKLIIVATHSHLFLAKEPENIWKLDEKGISIGVGPDERQNIVFNLLGNSPADIGLPEAVIICEGESDAIILGRIQSLMGEEYANIGIHFAEGDSKEKVARVYIEQGIKFLQFGPAKDVYSKLTCCLFDKAASGSPTEKLINELRSIEEGEGRTEAQAKEIIKELKESCLEDYYSDSIKDKIIGVIGEDKVSKHGTFTHKGVEYNKVNFAREFIEHLDDTILNKHFKEFREILETANGLAKDRWRE